MGKNNSEHIKTLNTSLEIIRYSMFDFIKVIREKINLWDRAHEDFHNREQRERTWQTVTQELCPNYNLLKETEQQELAKTMLKRWKNTRDCFLRAYRLQQMGDNRARPYIYEEELMFLLKGRSSSTEKTEKTIINDNDGDTKGLGSKDNLKKQNRKANFKSAFKPNETRIHDESPNTKRSRLECTIDNSKSTRNTLFRRRQSPRKLCSNIQLSALKPNQNNGISINEKLNKMECPTIKTENNAQLTEEVSSNINHNTELNNDCKMSISIDDANVEVKSLYHNISKSNDVKHQDIVINDNNCPKSITETILNDPDQAFFDSIKPHLQKMNDEQKLDFKIEVLNILRSFKK